MQKNWKIMKDEVQNRPPRPLLWALFLNLCLPFCEVRKKIDFGRLWAGAGGRGGGCLKLQILQILQKIQHAMLPLKGVRRILRASTPAAGPSKLTETRDLWFCARFCCIGFAWNSFRRYFLRAWRCFEELCGTFGSLGGLHWVPSSIFRDLGCNFRGLET